MIYRLIILPSAANFLKKIKEKPLKSAFQKAIDDIIQDLYSVEPKSGDLLGAFCFDVFYNKINYEISYTIIEENYKTIVVIFAGTRRHLQALVKTFISNLKDMKRLLKNNFKE